MVRKNPSKKAYQHSEALFDKLRAFDIEIVELKMFFNDFAIFDFESFYEKEYSSVDAEIIFWVGKQEPISVSVASNTLQEPIFLCSNEHHSLGSTLVSTIEFFAVRSRLEMLLNFHVFGATVKDDLNV